MSDDATYGTISPIRVAGVIRAYRARVLVPGGQHLQAVGAPGFTRGAARAALLDAFPTAHIADVAAVEALAAARRRGVGERPPMTAPVTWPVGAVVSDPTGRFFEIVSRHVGAVMVDDVAEGPLRLVLRVVGDDRQAIYRADDRWFTVVHLEAPSEVRT